MVAFLVDFIQVNFSSDECFAISVLCLGDSAGFAEMDREAIVTLELFYPQRH